ncbi:MAG: hypothetical protein U0Z17_00565 [Bacteroidales bacterium]
MHIHFGKPRSPHYKHQRELEEDRQRIRAEKKRIRARERSWKRRQRAEAWRSFRKGLVRFLSNPFAKRQLTEAQRERRRMKAYERHERKHERQKWWADFRKNPWRTVFPRRQPGLKGGGFKLSKRERRELARQNRRKFRENLYAAVTTPELRKKFGFAYLHSTAYLILAFMLIYVLYQVITILVASSYHIPIEWYYYRLKFPLYTYSPLYTREALVVIFAMGPILSLMLAFVFLKLFFTENVILKRFQLFYLWGFICGANMFFGAYIAGFITRTEFIYTSEWLFMSRMFDSEEIVFTIISLVMMLVIGRIVTPLFMFSSGSVTLVKPGFRLFFMLSRVVFPWLTAVLVLFLITLPEYYFPLILKTLTPGLIVIPTLFMFNAVQFENIHQSGIIQRNYFRWSVVIVAVAVLFFYRVLLTFGLKVM